VSLGRQNVLYCTAQTHVNRSPKRHVSSCNKNSSSEGICCVQRVSCALLKTPAYCTAYRFGILSCFAVHCFLRDSFSWQLLTAVLLYCTSALH
jgi:hypothetical protein